MIRNGKSETDLNIIESVQLNWTNSEHFGRRELSRTMLEELLLKHLKKKRREGAKIEQQKSALVNQRLLNRNLCIWKSTTWNSRNLEPRKQNSKKPSFLIDSWTAGILFENTNVTITRDNHLKC